MNKTFMKNNLWMKNRPCRTAFQNNYEAEFQEKSPDPHVGCFTSSLQLNSYRFFLDKEITTPDSYRDLLQCLFSANENEVIEIFISNGGGVAESALNIISGIRETDALVRCVITGSCHSAASLVAMACHEVVVLDFAHMLCHSATFGSSGKTTEIMSHVKFLEKYLSDVAFDIYKDFLTEKEIQEMLEGKDFWFDAEEIRARFQKRFEIQEERAKEQEEQEKIKSEVQEPVKKSSKKKSSE